MVDFLVLAEMQKFAQSWISSVKVKTFDPGETKIQIGNFTIENKMNNLS